MASEKTSSDTMTKYEQKRAAILDASIRLFNDNGIGNTSIAMLSSAAGLTKTGIIYYFKSKDELILAGFEESFKELERMIAQAQKASTPEARLQSFIEQYFVFLLNIRERKAIPLLSFGYLRALTEPIRSVFFERYNDLFRAFRTLIRPENSTLDDRVRLNTSTRFIQEQVQWCRNWITRYPVEDYARVGSLFADILINGVNPAGVEWSDPSPLNYEAPTKAKEILLQKAISLINEFGYRGASVDKIARKLDRTKGAFYHHYTKKEDLIMACYENTFSIINSILKQRLEGDNSRDRLNHAVSNLIRFQFDPAGSLLEIRGLLDLPFEKREPINLLFKELADDLYDLVVDGIIEGSLRPVEPQVASQMLIGTIFTSVELTLWFREIIIDNAASYCARFFFEGVCKGRVNKK